MTPQRYPKVVLVTGCSKGGIGHALCEEYRSQGCRVYATARRLDSMDEFHNEGILTMKLDVTDDDEVQQVVETIMRKERRIDVLVNNAAILCAGPVVDVPLDRVFEAYDANVFSALRMSRAVIPHMAARRSGAIVNIGCISGEIPTPWAGIHSATKSSLATLSDVLYMECLPFNVSVTLVSAGSVVSNLQANGAVQFDLPSNSLYRGYLRGMSAHVINKPQDSSAVPAEEFAKDVALASLVSNPPRYMTLGGQSTLFQLFKWIPRTWVLQFLWNRMGGDP